MHIFFGFLIFTVELQWLQWVWHLLQLSLCLIPDTGLSKDTPPPEPELPEVPRHGPPRFQPDGERHEWLTDENKENE